MTLIRTGCAAAALSGVGLLMLLASCAVTGVGVDGSVGYDAGYYEPYGYEYGGWGPDYYVGPGRGGDPRGRGPHPGGSGHGYRPAPSFRPTPSIPRGSRAR